MLANKIVLPEIDPAVVQTEIEEFLIRKVTEAGLSGGVLGVSGGIDSATVAYLAASAFRKHGGLKLYTLSLQSSTNSSDDERDAAEMAAVLGAQHKTVHIQPLVESFAGVITDVLQEDYHRGNLSSEIRAVILSRHAAAHNCMVLGTGNRDEDYCLGYFTKRGDGAVDISPIGSLSKRHVKELAAHMGVPDRIVNKTPTAGLWSGQTDEGELGFTYELAEMVLAGRDQGLTREEIAVCADCHTDQVDKVLTMHSKNCHKMSMPDVAPVSYLA